MKRKLIIMGVILALFLCGCGADADQNSNITQSPDSNADEQDETQVVQKLTLDPDSPVSTSDLSIQILGCKLYDVIEGESYTDTPDGGKNFLVLFLGLRNKSDEVIYFTPEGLSATVDGEKIEHKFLVNDPEGYTTAFQNIPAKGIAGGFIVWEVPEEWNEFSFIYDGWVNDGISIQCTLTPDMLSDPEPIESGY